MQKNFFIPKYFNPRVARIFATYCRKSEGDINLKMFYSNGVVQYDAPGFILFIPKSVLSDGKFGKIEGEGKLILSMSLSEEDLIALIRKLGGTCRKVVHRPSNPTLGDLLKEL